MFTSKSGERVALLSHSELRDSSQTELTVKGHGFRSYTAYEYTGDGDDYMGRKSVEWLDEHHLKVKYSLDPRAGVQQCLRQVGDIDIICDPQPPPFN